MIAIPTFILKILRPIGNFINYLKVRRIDKYTSDEQKRERNNERVLQEGYENGKLKKLASQST